MIKYCVYFLKGLLIGVSFLVPGMSGGTMMILLNVFDEAIHSLSSLMRGKIHKLDLMVIMGIGVILALALFSPLLLSLLNRNYELTISFFLGVIAAGLLLFKREIDLRRVHAIDVVHLLLGIVIVLVLNHQASAFINLDTQADGVQFITLIIVGIPVAVALILPGISTSFLLLSFGAYEMVLTAITSFDLSILVPLAIGIVLGTVALTHFLENQLKKNRRRLYLIILGFIVGSVFDMFNQFKYYRVEEIPFMILLFMVGFVIMFAINYFNKNA
ncbi:hypothetical protein AOC36_02465 [Erysipelothrix larvae]|uniref:DUF368 domain-containing protein n=1 Tax=Erysipelothrix larvae TaxID=1514105 RepID=A0A0X8GYT0_9FIRM|nr:DUF368 domain-containing protein [Erysipelothrix larvae]AMC92885.1 hypothetical protein AOC36_02465 [Erysipelothrix larvae]